MNSKLVVAASPLIFALAACGGGSGPGGSSNVISTPPPTSAPPTTNAPPPPTSSPEPVSLISTTMDTNFAVAEPARSPQISVRYEAATNQYLVSYPAENVVDAVVRDNDFSPTDMETGAQGLLVDATPVQGKIGSETATDPAYLFKYSTLLTTYDSFNSWTWGTGAIGVGLATPAADMPVDGTASYAGIARGTTTASTGGPMCDIAADLTGQINFLANFSTGTLSGELRSTMSAYGGSSELPALPFEGSIGSGSNSFAGTFTTALAGNNVLSGQFTGPAAEELIGSFTFPFVMPQGYIQASGTTGEAWGAFIAKR